MLLRKEDKMKLADCFGLNFMLRWILDAAEV